MTQEFLTGIVIETWKMLWCFLVENIDFENE